MRKALLIITIAAIAASGCSSTAPEAAGPSTTSTTTESTPVETTEEPTESVTSTTPAVTSTPPVTTTAGPPGNVFPISPASAASYGQVHHDYPATDMFAPCGSDVVAPASGVIEDVSRVDTWSAANDDPAVRGGISLSIVGDDGVRYYGSHLLDILPNVNPGVRVAAGEVVAHVGDTGNAAGTGCHLHFGISPDCGPGDWEVRRGTIYPWPYLDAWRNGGQLSPVVEVQQWLAQNAERCVGG